MKKLFYFILFLPVIFIASCSDDDDDTNFEVPELTVDNSIHYVVAHDVTQMVGKFTQLNVAGKKIAIDWGDGTIEKYSSKEMKNIQHSYKPETGEYTVKIWTENLTSLFIDGANNAGTSILSSHMSIGNAPMLKELIIRNCAELISLDVSKCFALEHLDCVLNNLVSLDISSNLELEYIDCSDNSLTSLDISLNKELKHLVCLHNEMNALDISKNLELQYLICHGNNLTNLDVSKNKELKYLSCGANQLEGSILDQIFEDLSTAPWAKTSEARGYVIQYAPNPGFDDCHPSIIENKGWTIIEQTFPKD